MRRYRDGGARAPEQETEYRDADERYGWDAHSQAGQSAEAQVPVQQEAEAQSQRHDDGKKRTNDGLQYLSPALQNLDKMQLHRAGPVSSLPEATKGGSRYRETWSSRYPVNLAELDDSPGKFDMKTLTERTVVHASIQLQPWPLLDAANCSMIRAQNAGRSSGQRLEVRFWSVTTSWSTTLPPALRMSVRTLG
jgi:hypothetical protein